MILVVSLAVSVSAPVAGQDEQRLSTADSIQALTQALATSWEGLDADRYLGWFADDVVFYFEGQVVARAELEASVRAAMSALRSSTFEVLDPRVEVLNPDAAAISFQLRELMVDASGATTDLRGALTLVWSRSSGGWRIVLAHESLPPSGD